MKTIGYLFAFGAAVTWGLTYVINEKLLERMSPIMLVFLVAVPVTVVGIPVLIANPQPLRDVMALGGKTHLLLLAAIATTTLANYLITSSVKMLDAPTAAVFEIIYPLFVVIFSAVFLGTTMNAWFAIGGALIFAGSYVIMRYA